MTDIRPLSSAILTLYPTIRMWLSGPDAAQSNPSLSVGGLMTRDVVRVQWLKAFLARAPGWFCQVCVPISAPDNVHRASAQTNTGFKKQGAGGGNSSSSYPDVEMASETP